MFFNQDVKLVFSPCQDVSTHHATWVKESRNFERKRYYEGSTNFDTTEAQSKLISTCDLYSLWSRDTGSKPFVGSGTEAQM